MKTTLILLSLLIVTSCSSLINKNRSYHIAALDVLTSPGKTVELSAYLLKDSSFLMFYDNVGEEVKFYNGNKFLGSSRTNDDGIATLYTSPITKVGDYEFSAKNDHSSSDAIINIKVIKKNSPIIITDIGKTLTNVGVMDLLISDYKTHFPIANAKDVLNSLAAKKYEVIYLTDRDKHLANTTKLWLKHHSFPTGPVFFWDALNRDVPFWSEDYKQEFISDLKKRFPNLLVGFGDKFGDIKAYRQNEMRAYHLFRKDFVVPRDQWKIKRKLGGHIRATTWKSISEHLENFPLDR